MTRTSVGRVAGIAVFVAVLALLGAGVVSLNTGCGDDECLEHGENCSASYLEANGLEGAECCIEEEICCTLAFGSGIPTCQRPGSCD